MSMLCLAFVSRITPKRGFIPPVARNEPDRQNSDESSVPNMLFIFLFQRRSFSMVADVCVQKMHILYRFISP